MPTGSIPILLQISSTDTIIAWSSLAPLKLSFFLIRGNSLSSSLDSILSSVHGVVSLKATSPCREGLGPGSEVCSHARTCLLPSPSCDKVTGTVGGTSMWLCVCWEVALLLPVLLDFIFHGTVEKHLTHLPPHLITYTLLHNKRWDRKKGSTLILACARLFY